MAGEEGVYSETLRVPTLWWLLGLLMAATVGWVFVLVTPLWFAVGAGLVSAGLVGWGLASYGDAVVRADDQGLRAGRALLPWPCVGPSVALDATETRRQVGPDADARAYLLLRSYCPGAVKVYVDDEIDPAPYWIVSSRRAPQLADHLNRRIVQD